MYKQEGKIKENEEFGKLRKGEREWEKKTSRIMLLKVDYILRYFPIFCRSVDPRLLSLFFITAIYSVI